MPRILPVAALAAASAVVLASPAGAARVPGDTMVYKNNGGGPAPQTVKTAALPTFTFTVRGPQPRAIIAMDFDNPANVLWGVDSVSSEVGTIDLATGAFLPVSTLNPPLPADTAVAGMSFDPTSTIVYISLVTQTGVASLQRVNLATGARTSIGPLFPGIVAIAVDNGGQMYGLDIPFSRLVRINKATGATNSVGPLGFTLEIAPMGMDFDSSDGTLYACVRDTPSLGHLVSIATTNGQATILASGDEVAECAVDVPTTPSASLSATALAVDPGGNGVLQPNESAVMAPTWRNTGITSAVTGLASNFSGPAGATYAVEDATASYGTIAIGTQASCSSTGDCYALRITAAGRPATHWDSGFTETISPGNVPKAWTLHVGDSFADVPAANPFYRFIETLLHHSVTGGCGANAYCPATPTTREQMAVFVLVAKEGASYVPPPCGAPMFADVPDTSPFCRWIEELANRGVVAGCAPNLYCPASPVTREQMSVFVLRTLDPALSPPACTAPMFADVPASSPFCRWIEELARRGVVTGCGGGNYCPESPVTREQMGVFLSVTFSLGLYGP